TNITREKGRVDFCAKRVNSRPLLFGVGLGDARGFIQPGNRHLDAELTFRFLYAARNGRRAGRLRSTGERNVTLAGEKSRRWVEADPPRAGQKHLCPGMEIGKIFFRADWT